MTEGPVLGIGYLDRVSPSPPLLPCLTLGQGQDGEINPDFEGLSNVSWLQYNLERPSVWFHIPDAELQSWAGNVASISVQWTSASLFAISG